MIFEAFIKKGLLSKAFSLTQTFLSKAGIGAPTSRHCGITVQPVKMGGMVRCLLYRFPLKLVA